MKEDWLKDIHDKMADYETDEPQGLWDDIRRAQMSRASGKEAGRANATAWLWTKRIALAAAAAALIIVVSRLTLHHAEAPTTDLVAKREQPTATPALSATPETATQGHDYTAPAMAASLPRHAKSSPAAAEQGADAPAIGDMPAATEPKAEAESTKTERQPSPATPPKRGDGGHAVAHADNYLAHAATSKGKTGRLSLGVYTAGNIGSALNSTATASTGMMSVGPNMSAWNDSPLLGLLVYNQGMDVETDIKHRLPVRIGVSLAYQCNDRLSLESGITYTHLASDLREGTSDHYFKGEQSLHYIGIPLNLKYKLLAWRGLEVYASTGLFAEKCVSGDTKIEYVLDNEVRQSDTKSISTHPYQLSVNASAGLQYNIWPSVGVYAEPGVSYYFDDGSSIETIYKDKPLNFNLNIGIRFHLGRDARSTRQK